MTEVGKLGYAVDLAKYWFLNRIPPRPRVFRIEVTNHCNLRCTICDRNAVSRRKEMMDWPLFERLCTNALEFGIPHIGLGLFGEVMLHPQLPEMIAFAKKGGARCVEFTTNGTLLNEERTRRVLEAGLDELIVSIDGFQRSTYESIRTGASYDEVVANVHRAIAIRDALGARTKIQLNFVCTRQTIGEARDFYRYWRKRVDGFFFIPFMGYADAQNMSPMAYPRRRMKCYMLWYMLVSSVDGRAGVCCHGDPNMELDVGDLKTQSIEEVWNSPAIQRIRQIHRRKAWRDLPVCERCDLTCPYTRWIRHFMGIYARVHIGYPGRAPKRGPGLGEPAVVG